MMKLVSDQNHNIIYKVKWVHSIHVVNKIQQWNIIKVRHNNNLLIYSYWLNIIILFGINELWYRVVLIRGTLRRLPDGRNTKQEWRGCDMSFIIFVVSFLTQERYITSRSVVWIFNLLASFTMRWSLFFWDYLL